MKFNYQVEVHDHIHAQVQFIDHKKMVIQFHDELTQDLILTWKKD